MAKEPAPPEETGATAPVVEQETTVRVRYYETDSQGVVHHAAYLGYFEVGRTELLRAMGLPYTEVERQGTQLMVTEAALRYHSPARYDDELTVRTRLDRTSRARVYLSYEVRRGLDRALVCTGWTILVAIARATGKPCPLPPALRGQGQGRRHDAP